MYSDQSGVPFYVGKGSGSRFYMSNHLSNEQPFLKRKIKKVGVDNVKVHFLHKSLTEERAFELETFYIKQYGRRNLGKGTLCNLTNGGEGIIGHVHSEETLQKMSENNKGENNPMYGTHHTKKSKKKMSENTKGKKYDEKTRQKVSKATKGKNNPMYGRKHSEESKQKMSEAKKGKKLSKKTRQKMSIAKKVYWTKKKNEYR